MTHEKLVLEAFDKAFKMQKSKGASASKKAAAEEISDYLDEHFRFSFTERRLRDYYTAAQNGEVVLISQQTVRDGMASFLGFEDFQAWSAKQQIKPEKPKFSLAFILAFARRNKTTILFITIGLVLLWGIQFFTKERWMVWEGDRFVEVPYDKEEFKNGQFLIFDEIRAKTFYKIIPDCQTKFFDPSGKPLIWYGKNGKKGLEYFTASGNHPETQKPLKPITKYMIAKYICDR